MKFLAFVFSILLALGVNAQVVDKTEQKAKDKANKRVDKKIDQQLDKGLDAIEGLFGSKKKKSSKKNDDPVEEPGTSQPDINQMNAMMGMMNTVDIDRTYEFQDNFRIKIESYKRDKLDSELYMKMYLNNENASMGIELEGEGSEKLDFMVYDMNENEMLTMMTNEGQKMGMLMKTDRTAIGDDENKPMPNVSFEKTGNSKNISGYNCDEYKVLYEGSEEDQYFWITTETDADWIKSMTQMAAYSPNMPVNYGVPDNYPEGSVIQLVQYSEKDKEKTITTVVEMNMNQTHSVSTQGYKFMEMPSSQGGAYPGR